MKVLVTGAAGFIGSNVSQYLLSRGDEVVGLDNINDYYDVRLKEARLERLQKNERFSFVKMDVADKDGMAELFKKEGFDNVIHLAAQAGVRYSLENPHVYMESNIIGTLNILEGCRHNNVNHLVYASSSSVYGANTLQPFSEHHNVDHPVSLYAASKKSNELMAHSYSHLYGMKTTGLRFFTVYGPWGRPDMALFLFTKGIIEGTPIDIFNNGDMIRDFTYVDDIVEGVVRSMDNPPGANPEWSGDKPDPATSYCNYRVFNIGNNNPVKLMDFVEAIEEAVGKKAIKNLMPMQAGDVPSTCADVSELESVTGFRPNTSVKEGIARFVSWYREFYQV
ncbi:NAD-dependent epimerase [Pleionea sp. CnH1-48]|uniref:NAD-dependent epimerase n=1 Tax=Pleionea sp. CnH1-48 TaxID=2954494 RepID=UPI00209820E2|nr:NAD-dependent epimerase [Pleionea sp. CnH1-48]MCO7225361.1 NAD-dependent epimerase [Pleionea sp. CnH1-48]